jgi:citrate synthase
MEGSGTRVGQAELKLPEKTISLPIVVGSEGEKAIEVTELRKQTGYITLDTGYMNTGSCESDITFIDGEKGILRYRGIPIEQLAEKSSFIETSYLLMYGTLPTKTQLEDFHAEIKKHMMLHEDIKRFYDGFPRDAHPMATLASVVCSLSTFYQHEYETGDPSELHKKNCIRLLAKLPTIAAFSYKKSVGQPFMYPNRKMSFCENFLHMMFGSPVDDCDIDFETARILGKLWILHADHEQNCSTSAVRLVRSSSANIFASITAGICALWGPRHGGANERVIEMLEEIRVSGGDVKKFVEKVKDKSSGVRLMGFGHRVYKNRDPRAEIIKESVDQLFSRMNRKDELLDIARHLEEAALSDPYFIERKLYPNVDFYSGIIYRAMGIPVNAFTVMFAIGRLPGWIAQAEEFTSDPDNKIGRPRQVYTGPTIRDYVAIDKR